MKKKHFISENTQDLAYYSIFKEKREELEAFIEKEISTWGAYHDIPENIKGLIDTEFIALGKYGKRINVFNIEARLSSGEL